MYDKKTRLSVLSMTDTVFPGGMNIHHLKTLAIDHRFTSILFQYLVKSTNS